MRTFKNLKRGFFLLFATYFSLAMFAFIFESCQKDDSLVENSSKEKAINRFEDLISKSASEFRNFASNNAPADPTVSARNLSDLTIDEAKNLSEAEAKELLRPFVSETKKLLLEYDITNKDLAEEFDDLDDPRIVIIGLALLTGERAVNENIAFDVTSLFGTSVYAQTGNKAIDCALGAIGFNSIDLIKGAIQTGGKAAIKTLIKSVASRFLGPIGIAIMVAEFGWCMSV